MIEAQIVADSKNGFGNRITTFLLTMPRIVLAEFNTHRMLTRNSASSRAIPFKVMIKRLEENYFKPSNWMKDHSGMQGTEYFSDLDTFQAGPDEPLVKTIDYLATEWRRARDYAIIQARLLNNAGLSKQFCNRLLEPFMWHQVITTATEWENFFALRAHEAAEVHIQELAYKMLEEYNKSTPEELRPGQWHIPFRELINEREVADWTIRYNPNEACWAYTQQTLAKVSAGICAGISYGRVKEDIDFLDMIDLYQSLVQRPYEGKRGIRLSTDPIHASPTEHQAMAMSERDHNAMLRSESPTMAECGWNGNFRGFFQFRKMLQNENASDPRVIKK